MTQNILTIGDRIRVVPVIHGSGDSASEVRRVLLSSDVDCVAVPLPPSFQADVEEGILNLPGISLVAQAESPRFLEDDRDGPAVVNYVPIDPCQPVIAAIRIAMQEHIPRAFIDLETDEFESIPAVLPDAYALKQVSLERFAAAVLPALPRLPVGQPQDRVKTMASRLRELEKQFHSIVLVCSITQWPWIREAYQRGLSPESEDDAVETTQVGSVDPHTLVFLLGELPHITGLYERARRDLDSDDNLSLDGVKDLVLSARDAYYAELKSRARKLSPQLLRTYFRYLRNLVLIERRMTPDLYTLVVAAQQIAGDRFALHVAETAREYPFIEGLPFPIWQIGIGVATAPDGEVVEMKSRLPGHPVEWRSCTLSSRPAEPLRQLWATRWDPLGQCSWPPEDLAIENFRTRVKDAALDLIGSDLVRTEKFTSSLKDGIDLRDTLRNWHTGDLYVKVFPPAKGRLDCVLMLFDSPADPRDYPWRITWHAENHDESTLSLFATDFRQQLIGPGLALASYGGAMFLFPPRPIIDIWRDQRFDFTDTLEERMLAAACVHSRESHIAVLSHVPPGAGWRRLARRFRKKLVHVPLGRFSQETVQSLRNFHVLNGRTVRSYAAHFIRKP
jgi:hypothetical protein